MVEKNLDQLGTGIRDHVAIVSRLVREGKPLGKVEALLKESGTGKKRKLLQLERLIKGNGNTST